MRKQNEQMPVRYKCLDDGQGNDFYFERSLDLIFSPGAFLVEIDHTGVKVGLPTEFCGGEHYIVGTLVVTDSGNAGATQKDRITGQVLMFTDRESKATKLYTRTFVGGEWSEWRSLAFTGMYENISTTDELLASVEKLLNETKVMQNDFASEVARATDAEQANREAIIAERNFPASQGVFWSVTSVGAVASQKQSASYQGVKIPVVAGEVYSITATGAGSARTFAVLGADNVCTRTNDDNEYACNGKEIVIGEGDAFLVVNSKTSVALVCSLNGSLAQNMKNVAADITKSLDESTGQIGYCLTENAAYLALERGTISEKGVDVDSATYHRSNYIAIDGEPAIVDNGALYRYYDDGKNFVGTEYSTACRFLRFVFPYRPSTNEKVYITISGSTTEYAVSRFAGVAARSDVAYNGDFAIKELYIPQGVAGSVVSEINSVRLQYTVSDGGYRAGFLFYNKSNVGVFQAMSYFDTAEEAADMLKRGFIDAPHCKVLFDVYNIVHNSNAYLKLDSKVSDLINSPTIAEFYCNDNLIEYGTENGYFISADGRKVESASYTTTEPIVLAKGYTIRVAAQTPNTVAAISVFNDGVYEPVSIGCSAGTVLLYEYTAGEDCLVVVSYMTSESGYVSVIGEMVSIVPELEFTMNYYMLSTGLVTGTTNNKFGYSSPFKVYRGDYLRLKLKASSTTAVLSKCDATGNIVDCVHKAVDEADTSYGYFVKEDGYMLVSGNVPTIELKIDRPNVARVALDNEIKSLELDEKYKRKKHYYVDNVGFAPEVNSGILVYEGDTKSTHNFIANAVAYPDGTIIACRAADVEDRNGCVVRIDNEGNETVLLTIADATDWRCCFMDRNLNVYVSPHSSIRPNGVNMGKGDRGLYRLAYGSDIFEKVIQLYNPVGDSPVETENESNDDTIWTMCEDSLGNIYAGVYAHSTRPNPAIYKSMDGGVTWEYKFNFITAGMTSEDDRRGRARHVHSLIYNPYNFSLYCVVGEVETVFKSSDGGDTWIDLDVRVEDAKATAMIAVPDGVIMASDGNREGVISKLYADDRTVKTVGKMWHGIFFGIKKSDITGNIYALSRLESALQNSYPPREAIGNPQALEDWKTSVSGSKVLTWQMYYDNIHKYYGHDEYMPIRYAILMSRDNGESWEIIHSADTGYTEDEGCGIQCSGYFRNGELCCGVTNEVNGVKTFVNPVIISEGQKRYKSGKPDISGEIFAKMNI